MCIGIRLNSTFFKRALCRISSLPFVERLPYTFLMSLDISIPLSDLFYFQRRSLCSPRKCFVPTTYCPCLYLVWLFLSENLVNGALENGTTVKGNDNECLTRHCKSTFEFQCYGNTNHNVSYVITNTIYRYIFFHTNLQSNIKYL